uniref:U3 small nucleolar ribonucleoprotein protein MPP10 n=1 Tax=Blastobotrys adeninivorans TaxID=409370 RepID=A0A060TBN6_BLAAD
MSDLTDLLQERPQDLFLADEKLRAASLQAVKANFDPIAKGYSIFDSLHVDGLDAEQVWAQARMVVDGVVDKLLGEEIPALGPAGTKRSADEISDESDEEAFGDHISMDSDEVSDDNADGMEDQDSEDEGFENIDNVDDYDELESEAESGQELSAEGEEGDEEEDDDDEEEDDDAPKKKSELDDGQFVLEDFKKQVLALENPNEDDDEEIDYFGELEDSDSDDDGADMKYEDFFGSNKSKKKEVNMRSKKAKKAKDASEDEDEEFEGLGYDTQGDGIERAMKSATKDLFEDESEDEEDQEDSNLSKFERQQKEIMRQIQELEDENVAEKHWAVRGEVKSRDRPQNSLLEHELDFERTSKPVPVITQEVTESLEDTIRRRIKNDDFDDLPRRLPDSLPEFKPSKLVDVQETKSQKSLAELYEEDYAKEQNPSAYRDAESEKLEQAHKEITDLFSKISHKLDALSSWNYTPKAPKPSLTVVANTATISMEEAQPATMSSESALAPQEIYKPGEESNNSRREVVNKQGLPVAKSEMTREERKRERRRAKAKRAKVMHEKEEKEKVMAQKSGSKADVLQTLKKGNVTVIGKDGEKRDVRGNLKKEAVRPTGANLRL